MANEVDNYLTIKGSAADIERISDLFRDSIILDEDLAGRSAGLFANSHIKLKKGEAAFFLNPGTKEGEKYIDHHYEGRVYLQEGSVSVDDKNTLEAYLQTGWDPLDSGWLKSLAKAFPMTTIINDYEDENLNYYGTMCWNEGSYDEGTSFEVGERTFEDDEDESETNVIDQDKTLKKEEAGNLSKLVNKIQRLEYTVLAKTMVDFEILNVDQVMKKDWRSEISEIDIKDWEFEYSDCSGAEYINILNVERVRSRIERVSEDEEDRIRYTRLVTINISIDEKDLASFNADIKKYNPTFDFFKIPKKERLSEINGIMNLMLSTNLDWSENVDFYGEDAMFNSYEKIHIREP